jgi:hypothetical protein
MEDLNLVMPMCALCNRPVDRMIQREASWIMGYEFTVECHGRWETMTILREDLEESEIDIRAGVAFKAVAALPA